MVLSVALFAVAVASVADIGQSSPPLQVGDYFRPPSDQVTAFADSTSPVTFRRSPCPGLNALANHGHIPRSGKNITHENLGAALMSVFNTDSNFTQTLLNQVPATFSLDVLSRHNVVEHDASLMHDDAFFGVDPMNVNKTLVNDLFNRSLDGKTLGVTELGETRRDRLAACRANNPQCVFGANQTAIAYPRGCGLHHRLRWERQRVCDDGSCALLRLARTDPRELHQVS